jgi:hypothetical protein
MKPVSLKSADKGWIYDAFLVLSGTMQARSICVYIPDLARSRWVSEWSFGPGNVYSPKVDCRSKSPKTHHTGV